MSRVPNPLCHSSTSRCIDPSDRPFIEKHVVNEVDDRSRGVRIEMFVPMTGRAQKRLPAPGAPPPTRMETR